MILPLIVLFVCLVIYHDTQKHTVPLIMVCTKLYPYPSEECCFIFDTYTQWDWEAMKNLSKSLLSGQSDLPAIFQLTLFCDTLPTSLPVSQVTEERSLSPWNKIQKHALTWHASCLSDITEIWLMFPTLHRNLLFNSEKQNYFSE